ncbi:MAG: hypothetical protein IPM81_14055 [Saprospirales bacterium]|jgi:hypothetical protein|nr:hypothetical protein [Saprospirales bacterium]
MSSFKRKLAKSPQAPELLQPETGAYYSVQFYKGYALLKVLALDVDRKGTPTTVHTCLYCRTFDTRPVEISASGLFLSAEESRGQDMTPGAIMRRMLEEQGTYRHRQFTYEGFLTWKPVFIASGTLTEAELKAYRFYLEFDEDDEEYYCRRW